ncbi:hypothetical protein LZC95_08990 [Pendulispora brunnea]|uniref:Uncharacterized protein n=1 Tax=Pendulispora brunnea TaxID=2905690 RepID=A0ABZ2KHB6_9BACT
MANPLVALAPRRRLLALVGVLVIGILLVRPVGAHLRATGLLLRFAAADPATAPWLARASAHAVDEESSTLETATGPTRARLYVPHGVGDPPAVVIVPGVHRLGVDEPRLQRFARSIASSGVAVYTPEVKALTEYRIEPASIGTIGEAAKALAQRRHKAKVGIMGMSFAGGLALLAAADPRYAPSIAFVVAVGAHDDLSRVARFFATNEIPAPDGHPVHMKAHDYGTAVLLCDHAEEFFSAEDAPGARNALRHWLWGEEGEARALAAKLDEASRKKLELLFERKGSELAPDILRVVDGQQAAMRDVSPRGHLAGLRVPIFLLHGAGDSVIPPSETSWLATEVPSGYLKNTLISPAVQHVELQGEPSVSDRWALVHFMAQILEEAEDERTSF